MSLILKDGRGSQGEGTVFETAADDTRDTENGDEGTKDDECDWSDLSE